MSSTIRLVSLALLVGSVARAQGFPPAMFGPLTPLPGALGTIVEPLLVDLDADGRPDVVGQSVQHQLAVLMNLGDGAFSEPKLYPLPDTLPGRQLRAGDLDLDGQLDVLAVGQDPDQLQALPGDGTGALLAGVSTDSPQNFGVFGLGDLDGDGIPDVVYPTLGFVGPIEIRWQRGLGNLAFGPPKHVTVTSTVQEIEVVDLDLDGHLDIAACETPFILGGVVGVAVVRGLGGGAFEVMPEVPMSGLATPSMEITDLNRDGWPDLLVHVGNGVVRVAPGDGGALFAPGIDLPVPALGSPKLWATDLDVDGYDDLLLWGQSQLTAQRVGPELSLVGPPSVQPLVATLPASNVADLDGDGVPEPLLIKGLVPSVAYNQLGPIIDLGFGFPAGAAPTLLVIGEALPLEFMSCELQGPTPGTPSLLVLGLEPAHLPVPGGTLVPAPQVILPLLAGQPLVGRWPTSLPPGAPLYLQALLLADSAASNALVVLGQ